jgi:hypothetical protein
MIRHRLLGTDDRKLVFAKPRCEQFGNGFLSLWNRIEDSRPNGLCRDQATHGNSPADRERSRAQGVSGNV